jgi:hypothetical protein
MIRFRYFLFKKIVQPPPFEEFLEINFQFSIVSILHTYINSLVDNTPDFQGRGPGFNSWHGRGVTAYIFAITTH